MTAATFTNATYKRVRGLASWNPQKRTHPWIDAVLDVLDAERADWPVGSRHIAYQKVGHTVGGLDIAKGTSPKAKKAWSFAEQKVQEVCNRGRRSGMIPWEAIADDGIAESHPRGQFDGEPMFRSTVQAMADGYTGNPLAAQRVHVEVWAEAAGMVQRLARVADPNDVSVYSGGGFDSLDAKRRAALRVLNAVGRRKQFVALHVGDLDQHGHWLFGAIAEDVTQLAIDMLVTDYDVERDTAESVIAGWCEIRRLAVTPDQVEDYDLPADPDTGNLQAEAVPAAIMRALLTDALDGLLDPKVQRREQRKAKKERAAILARLGDVWPA